MKRPSWDQYFMAGAVWAAGRADCSRRQVGALIADTENRIVSTGYNGSFPGGPSCLAGECPRAASGVEPGSSYDTGPGMCHSVHAEANAILFADRERLRDATLYVTAEPCQGCWKLIFNTRISKVVYPGEFRVEYIEL
jgi:dCMP deaminase